MRVCVIEFNLKVPNLSVNFLEQEEKVKKTTRFVFTLSSPPA